MHKKAIEYLRRNYYLEKEEEEILNQLIELEPYDIKTVKVTPWIDKMSVYWKGKSVKAFISKRKGLDEITYYVNPILMKEE